MCGSHISLEFCNDVGNLCCFLSGHVRFLSLSCGSQNVWACDTNGMVYFRVGTQPLNPSMMLPAWICIEPPEQVNKFFDMTVKLQSQPIYKQTSIFLVFINLYFIFSYLGYFKHKSHKN